eukprot:Ihof_evm9s47 gene=Ihof_evmTU9s47
MANLAKREGEVSPQPFLSGTPAGQTYNDYSKSIMRALRGGAMAANDLPVGEEYEFYRSFASYVKLMEGRQTSILERLQSLLQAVQPGSPPDLFIGGGNTEEDVQDRFDKVVDTVEGMFERVDIVIDRDIKKIMKNTPVVANVKPSGAIGGKWNEGVQERKGPMQVRHLQKPQLKFTTKVNNERGPFVPLIKEKPNALVALEEVMSGNGQSNVPAAPTTYGRNDDYEDIAPKNPHPYGPELDAFVVADSMAIDPIPQLYKALDETPLTYVDTVEALEEMVAKLNDVTEIAIDLEAHSHRTFSGIVCLMQISTRTEDFIVDPLALRNDLHILNQPFTNPNIVKVLHGADFDIVWLQRDFGIYIVNMFDTGQAARVLEIGKYSLAYLLHFYCDVTANKQYQLADWRIRPLGDELMKYAREDTHYLLYIYDRLRAELVAQGNQNMNLLKMAWDRSTDICRKRFEKPQWSAVSYRAMMRKYQRSFLPAQERVFKALYDWRDMVARQEDESCRYVLPNHMMFEIVGRLPTEAGELFACCNPVPPLIRMRSKEILSLISKAASSTEPLPEDIKDATIQSNENVKTAAASPKVIASGAVNFSRHLYNPVAWVVQETKPAVSLEERIKSCPPMMVVEPPSTFTVFQEKKPVMKVDSKADDIIAAMVLPFSLIDKIPEPEPVVEVEEEKEEEEADDILTSAHTVPEEEDIVGAGEVRGTAVLQASGVDVEKVKGKVVVLSAMEGAGKKAKKRRQKDEKSAKRTHEDEDTPVAKKGKTEEEVSTDSKGEPEETSTTKTEPAKKKTKKEIERALLKAKDGKSRKERIQSENFISFDYGTSNHKDEFDTPLPEIGTSKKAKVFTPYTKLEEVQT